MANGIYGTLFLKKLWPDFKPSDLTKIIKNYKKIKRNYGNI